MMEGKPLLKFGVALLLALAAFAIIRGVASAAEPVLTDQRIEGADGLTVGDRFRYVIKVEADSGTTVTLAPGGLPPELSLSEAPAARTLAKGQGRIEVTLTLEVAAFFPGPINLEPLRLSYRGSDGATGVIETRPGVIVVESVLPSSGELTPRDLKPQAEIGAPPPMALYAAAAVLVVVLILVLGLLVWRQRALRRRLVAVPEPVVEALGPEDRARAILDKAGDAFEATGDYVAYYSDIAVTVRNYLTERFGFPAFALTTRELQEEMVRRGVDRWQARLASGLLSQCDAVVYAHYRPAHERADADLTAAYEIVEMSRPEETHVEGLRQEAGVS
ncbi:MAG: hypothetical protein GEU75_10275 [Dehalococcoidia bacterium]|nr:hypothetical protein [Dehalococcoidia bacterium]